MSVRKAPERFLGPWHMAWEDEEPTVTDAALVNGLIDPQLLSGR